MGREEEGGVNGHRLIRLPGNFRMEGFWRVESVCDNKRGRTGFYAMP